MSSEEVLLMKRQEEKEADSPWAMGDLFADRQVLAAFRFPLVPWRTDSAQIQRWFDSEVKTGSYSCEECMYHALTTRHPQITSEDKQYLYVILKGRGSCIGRMYARVSEQAIQDQNGEDAIVETKCALLSNPRWVRPLDGLIGTRRVYIDFSNFAHGLYNHVMVVDCVPTPRNEMVDKVDPLKHQMAVLLDTIRGGVHWLGNTRQTSTLVTLLLPSSPSLLICPSQASASPLPHSANYLAFFASLPPPPSWPPFPLPPSSPLPASSASSFS